MESEGEKEDMKEGKDIIIIKNRIDGRKKRMNNVVKEMEKDCGKNDSEEGIVRNDVRWMMRRNKDNIDNKKMK